ncbi:MAG: lactoylglutathione lyase [Sphingopyxis sp.]|nr:lactoylglutathione lyase [Sphingopyxis sp.]
MLPTPTNRMLHTMIRVADLDRSKLFYCDGLGMREIRRFDFPDQRFSLVYIGYDDDRSATVLELTWNWDITAPYSHGTGYGHVGIGVADLATTCAHLADLGFTIPRAPGPMMNSGIDIAFAEDPDGYRIELIALPFPPVSAGPQSTFT